MRATYEAYILVKVRDGSQYLCLLNRQPKPPVTDTARRLQEQHQFLATQVIWH